MDKNPHSRRVLDLGVGEVFFSSICHAGLDALSRGTAYCSTIICLLRIKLR